MPSATVGEGSQVAPSPRTVSCTPSLMRTHRVRDSTVRPPVASTVAPAAFMRAGYNDHCPHSALGMMTPVAFAASLRAPLPGPTTTAAGDGVKQRWPQTSAGSDPQPSAFQPGEQQSPAEEITPAASQANSHSSYRATTTTPISSG
jgi:hypothetical protein